MKTEKPYTQLFPLCEDTLGQVFDYLPLIDYISCSKVSQGFRKVAQSHQIHWDEVQIFQELVKHLQIGAVRYKMATTLTWPLSILPTWIQRKVVSRPQYLSRSFVNRWRDPKRSFQLSVYKRDKAISLIPAKCIDEKSVLSSDSLLAHVRLTVPQLFPAIKGTRDWNCFVTYVMNPEIPLTGRLQEIATDALGLVKKQVQSLKNSEQVNRMGMDILKEIVSQKHDAHFTKDAQQILDGSKTNRFTEERVDLIQKWQKKYY